MRVAIFLLILTSTALGQLPYDSIRVGDMTYIREDVATTNYGTNSTAEQYSYAAGVSRNVLLRFDETLVVIPAGSVFVACSMFVYCNSVLTGTPDPQVYEMLRAWTEGGATWNTYDGSNNWTTGGGEGSGTDRAATAWDSFTPATTTRARFELDSATVKDWLDGTSTNNGVLIWDAAPNNWAVTYATDDHGSNYPYARFYYDIDPNHGPPNYGHGPDGVGLGHSPSGQSKGHTP